MRHILNHLNSVPTCTRCVSIVISQMPSDLLTDLPADVLLRGFLTIPLTHAYYASRPSLLNLLFLLYLLLLLLFILLLRMFTYCPQSNNSVFFVPRHHEIAHKVAGGRHGPQTYRANASTPNKVSPTAHRRWSFRSGLVAKVTTRHSKIKKK